MPDKKDDNWMRTHWRPSMAYVFMAIVLFDFILGPIFWSIIQIIGSGTVSLQWMPLTFGSAGVFYASMGAILGVYAWSRGKEKIEEYKTINNDE
jgi:hypothetical protein